MDDHEILEALRPYKNDIISALELEDEALDKSRWNGLVTKDEYNNEKLRVANVLNAVRKI